MRALIAAVLTSLALLLGGGPAVAGPVVPVVDAAEQRPQTDEEEAGEVRTLLVLVGALVVLTVVVGAVAARRT